MRHLGRTNSHRLSENIGMTKPIHFNYPEEAHPILTKLWGKRLPDFVIGHWSDPYMERWWLIPKNKICNIYLHRINADDEDRAHHDHPWWNISIPLKGRIEERRTDKPTRYMVPGLIYFRKPTDAHRLVIGRRRGAPKIKQQFWSLFITRPRIRNWGFLCPKGWKPWEEFTSQTNPGTIGRGCGED